MNWLKVSYSQPAVNCEFVDVLEFTTEFTATSPEFTAKFIAVSCEFVDFLEFTTEFTALRYEFM